VFSGPQNDVLGPPIYRPHLLIKISPPYYLLDQKGGRPPRPPPQVGKLYPKLAKTHRLVAF